MLQVNHQKPGKSPASAVGDFVFAASGSSQQPGLLVSRIGTLKAQASKLPNRETTHEAENPTAAVAEFLTSGLSLDAEERIQSSRGASTSGR